MDMEAPFYSSLAFSRCSHLHRFTRGKDAILAFANIHGHQATVLPGMVQRPRNGMQ